MQKQEYKNLFTEDTNKEAKVNIYCVNIPTDRNITINATMNDIRPSAFGEYS
jgi:hypothetical protein